MALYCSKYLPDIIKEQKTYKDGKLQKVRNLRSRVDHLFVLNKDDRAEIFMSRCVLHNWGTGA